MDSINIREAQINDIRFIALLCDQLGYSTEIEDLSLRLKKISDISHHVIFIAELDHQVVGWIHVYLCPLLISGFQAQLGGLVVHEDFRCRGIGKELLQQAEYWARSRGCLYLSVLSNITRIETHQFYEDLDYQKIKTELVLRKKL